MIGSGLVQGLGALGAGAAGALGGVAGGAGGLAGAAAGFALSAHAKHRNSAQDQLAAFRMSTTCLTRCSFEALESGTTLRRVSATSLSVASWNVNSLRIRLPLVLRFLDETTPDVLCLQETRADASKLDLAPFEARGYHADAGGTRAYAGVATLSRRPIERTVHGFAEGEQRDRRILSQIGDVWVDNVYVPTRRAIGKSEFLDQLKSDYSARFAPARDRLVLCGDFNICFDQRDLASLNMIAEPEHFGQRPEDLAFRRLVGWGLHDCLRKHQLDAKTFSWFPLTPWALKRNYGMRLDYVFATSPVYASCIGAEHAREPRSWERPSDHLPVIARFDLS